MLLKPNQAHRIIRDPKPNAAVLQPIAVRDNSVRNSVSENGSILPRIDNSINNASEREQLEILRRRIKELEKDNFKLTHHVSQAEQSIKNYRGFLANRPSSSSMIGATRDYAVQTDVDSQTQLQQIAALQDRVNHQETQLKSQSVLNADLLAKNNEYVKENKKLREKVANESVNQGEVAQMQETIALQRKQITDFEDSLAQHSDRSKSADLLLESKLLKSVLAIKELQQMLKAVRNEVVQLDELNSFNRKEYETTISTIIANHSKESKQFEDRVNQLMIDKYQSEGLMNRLNSELVTARREMDQLVILHQKEQQLLVKQHQQEMQALQAQLQQRGSSGLSPSHSTPTQHNKLHPLMASLHHSLSPDHKGGKLLNSFKLPLPTDGGAHLTPTKHSSSSSTERLLGGSKSNAALLSEDDRLLLAEYKQKLLEATTEVVNLQLVHAAEIKAVQHVSHVKELSRVAKEREFTLERDKMAIDIKHLKEVQNVLIFSINTAEQSLNEAQPHVVVKLVEGRRKRLKLLEESLKGRMKDIDQRSMETCAVNTAHLEGFQKKAVDNSKTAETMTKAAVTKLLDVLKV